MRYQPVLFMVPISEQTEDDPKEWVRRELAFDGLLDTLHQVSRPADGTSPASAEMPGALSSEAARRS